MKRLLFFALCASVCFCACSDDGVDNNNGVDKNYQAKNFIKENLDRAKYSVTRTVSDQPTEISLDNGVKMTIPGGTVFTKNNGTPITGEYTVEIYTMLTPSQVILSGTNTNFRGGSYLESYGFFNINVLQNGQAVDQSMKQFINVSLPTEEDDYTWAQLWAGGDEDDQFAWEEVPDSLANAFIQGRDQDKGVVSFNKVFNFQFKKLGWYNCDVYWNVGNNTTVTVALTGRVGALADYQGYSGDTFVFFKAKASNVIAQLYTSVNATTVQSYDNSMPVGTEGTLIAFSVKDGECGLASREITITENQQETLELLPVDKETVLETLSALDVE
ncbi:MAG: hypothetical protein LBI96_01250 [Odoribacteraceae bacterium]|jgi:hypothetical protein|nr:hypothetical protein [Odoribacteraceae bacterium]